MQNFGFRISDFGFRIISLGVLCGNPQSAIRLPQWNEFQDFQAGSGWYFLPEQAATQESVDRPERGKGRTQTIIGQGTIGLSVKRGMGNIRIFRGAVVNQAFPLSDQGPPINSPQGARGRGQASVAGDVIRLFFLNMTQHAGDTPQAPGRMRTDCCGHSRPPADIIEQLGFAYQIEADHSCQAAAKNLVIEGLRFRCAFHKQVVGVDGGEHAAAFQCAQYRHIIKRFKVGDIGSCHRYTALVSFLPGNLPAQQKGGRCGIARPPAPVAGGTDFNHIQPRAVRVKCFRDKCFPLFLGIGIVHIPGFCRRLYQMQTYME